MTAQTGAVVVVGGGPAGLACALELRRRGLDEVWVLEREAQAGGIPRHCAHQGFGARDLRRLMSGPRYARRYLDAARRAGARVREEAMVTGWSASGELEVTSPEGRETVAPAAVVLATGCRERPRAARLVPGSRPEGVMTTETLQQLVKVHGQRIGARALVVGAEHVSFSALLTLRRAGADVVALVTDLPRHQSLAVVRVGAALRYRTPVWTRTAVAAIHGQGRVDEVELLDLDTGSRRAVPCDVVVFTADWIPDHELAVMAGLELEAGSLSPRVDTGLRTARTGVFAAGNLLHGAEPADIAALSGRHAAGSVLSWLAGGASWPKSMIPIRCAPPLRWVSPSSVSSAPDPPPRGRFLVRGSAFMRRPVLELAQDGARLWRGRISRVAPGRSTPLPASWIASVDPAGGAVEARVADASQSRP
jgi:thioredoxin reductase